jgi:uncharacterized protein YcbX
MWLSTITVYPVKSCYRLELDRAQVEPWGLAGDRRWMVVDTDRRLLTQRGVPALARVRPRLVDGGLLLRAPEVPDLVVEAPTGPVTEVMVWKDVVAATPAGSSADDWLSGYLDRKVHLVYLDDPRRPVNPKYGAPGDRVTFADAYPVLATNAASLDALNDWLVESGEDPVPMTRFRSNVVVSGAQAWAEDSWLGRRLRIGAVVYRAVKPCDRCMVIATDQETGVRGRQPLHMLGRRRRTRDGLLFGINLIPDRVGEISVGDGVSLV